MRSAGDIVVTGRLDGVAEAGLRGKSDSLILAGRGNPQMIVIAGVASIGTSIHTDIVTSACYSLQKGRLGVEKL